MNAEDKRFLEVVLRKNPMHPEDRIFKDAWHMIASLGCQVRITRKKDFDHLTQIGSGPTGYAQLLEGGVVWMFEPWAYPQAVHEAIHHFHGPEGFQDEGTMMALEFALLNMVQNDEHREILLLDFGVSEDMEMSIRDAVLKHGEAYFDSDRWKKIIEAGQDWVTKQGRIRAPVLSYLHRVLA